MIPSLKLPKTDLDSIGSRLATFLPELKGADLLLTGGTGFFGKWLLESLIDLSQRNNLGLTIHLVTRNRQQFLERYPHFSEAYFLSAIRWVEGDVRNLPSIRASKIDYVIHAATDTRATVQADDPYHTFSTILQGTEQVLNAAQRLGARKFLLTSSGAVYGPQPRTLSHLNEEYPGAPDCANAASAYGEGKRAAETIGVLASKSFGFDLAIARCFAFVGPHLPLNEHFAAGNFIRDALKGGPILIGGDGTPLRSYLYAADLVVWLMTLLFRGKSGRPYNVGSDEAVSIETLARLISKIEEEETGRKIDVVISKKPDPANPAPQRYVPSIERARAELGLEVHSSLEQAFRSTMNWYRGLN
jgi:dTDP-glucose 4,6-dehydratase